MKKKFKLIVPSFLTLIFCLLLIAGSTFAIFSSQAEASISVTSGKVELKATLDDLEAFSAEAVDAYQTGDLKAGTAEAFGVSSKYKYVAKEASNEAATLYSFTTGGTAELTTNKTLVLNKVVPGDRVTLNLHLHNDSNVAIKYRVRVNAFEDNGLYEALDINVGGKKLNGIIRVDAWTEWLPTESTDKDILLEVVLPITAGNEYQNKTAKLRFTVEAVQGNAKTDDLLDQVNAYLDTASGTNKTMQDAIDEIKAAATTENKFANFVATNYLWNKDTDQFYSESTIVSGFGEERFFKAYTYDQFDALTNPTFGIYAYSTSTSTAWPTSLTINHSFDQGEEAITTINYTRNQASDEAKEVSIRTNSLATNLNVDAPKDVVHHYGDAGILTIIAVAGQSYHEYGTVGFLDIAKGRVALEAGSSATQVHITKKAAVEEFDEIIVSIAPSVEKPTFSRDDVEISSQGTLVVALQQGTEDVTEETELDYVWLTKQGIYEQIKVSDNSESAGNVWVDQLTGSTTEEQAKVAKTQAAANEIANNIQRNGSQEVEATVQVGTTSYTVTLNEETRELVVAETAAPQAEVEVQTQAEAKEEAIQATGVKASEKAEIVNNVVEETISEEGKKADDEYVARIGTTYYKSFNDAFADATNNTTIKIIRNCSASGYGSYAYDASGKNLTIFVEEGVTLSCGTVTNGKFNIGWNSAAGTLTFAGNGKITFDGDSTWGLVTNNGSEDPNTIIEVVIKNVSIEAIGTSGFITSGHLTIESGYFKNIVFSSGSIQGGYFTSNVASYLVEGKVLSSTTLEGYNYVVSEVDASTASYSVTRNNEVTYFTTLSSASGFAKQPGDVLTFLKENGTVVLDQSNNKFWNYQGAIYDLNGNTIVSEPGTYPLTLFAEPVTVKDGTINVPAAYFCAENNTISFENVYFADALFDELLEHSSPEGYFVKDKADFFTYKETAPLEYAAKIVRGTAEMYYVGSGYVVYACQDAVNGDHIFVNEYNENAKITLLTIGDKVTITKDENTDFPTVVAGSGMVQTSGDGNTKLFEAKKAPVCRVGGENGVEYTSLAEGFKNLKNANTKLLELLDDVTLTGTTVDSNGNISETPSIAHGLLIDGWTYGTFTIDLNGHTITATSNAAASIIRIQGWAKISGGIGASQNNPNRLIITDSKGGGGISKPSSNTNCYTSLISGTNLSSVYTIYEISGGNFDNGTSVNNKFLYLTGGSGKTYVISGGTFSHNPANETIASEKTSQANGDGTYTVK